MIKFSFHFLILLLILNLFLGSCELLNQKDSKDSSSEESLILGAEELAQVTLDLLEAGKNPQKQSQIFTTYGYSLSKGSKVYIESIEKLKESKEQYQNYQEKLSSLVQEQLFGQLN